MVVQKKKVIRAFNGLSGSPLAKATPEDILMAQLEEAAKEHRAKQAFQKQWDKKIKGASKSDFALRVPKTPDREEPAIFDEWFDEWGQRHGRIDLDCAFQPYQFDPHLGNPAGPADCDTRPQSGVFGDSPASLSPEDAMAQGPGETSVMVGGQYENHILDIFGVETEVPKKQRSFSTGLIQGAPQLKQRSPSKSSWWVFVSELLKEFLSPLWDEDPIDAVKAASVIWRYYFFSWSDEQIFQNERDPYVVHPLQFFDTVKQVKQYRQFIIRKGAAQFEKLRGERGGKGQKLGKMRGLRCGDPACTQCSTNEAGYDFGRL